LRIYTTRCWEKNVSLPIDVGIRDSGDSTRCWEMLDMILLKKIGGEYHIMEEGFGLGFEITKDLLLLKLILWYMVSKKWITMIIVPILLIIPVFILIYFIYLGLRIGIFVTFIFLIIPFWAYELGVILCKGK